MKVWNFRPSALLSIFYAKIRVSDLFKHYNADNEKALKEGVQIPSRPKNQSLLRTCQWNIHFFVATDGSSDKYVVNGMVDALLEVDADVIVLNEFGDGMVEDWRTRLMSKRLKQSGYSLFDCDIPYPTAVATWLPIDKYKEIALDSERSAMAVRVRMSDGTKVWVYGTHLSDSDDAYGHQRAGEMRILLDHVHNNTSNEERILVAGDFNQQRQKDYSAQEWEAICANKARRGSPAEDGVARLLQESDFICMWDEWKQSNWDTPYPPATHWSGTIIDYTYARHLEVDGVYVAPSSLSDHRLIVCDWNLNPSDTCPK